MIIVKLMGGLGNQMFQYAFGRYLSLKHNAELKLDLSGLSDRTSKENFIFRNYELNVFNITASVANEQDMKSFKKNFDKKKLHHFSLRLSFPFDNFYLREPHFYFFKPALNAPENTYVDGYWQSEKYFIKAGEQIKKDFTPAKTLSDNSISLRNEIQKSQSVSVHVRRTDYLTNPQNQNYFYTCNEKYYLNAMRIIANKIPTSKFYIFSDDIDWFKKNIKTDFSVEYVENNINHFNYEDLWLMTLCKHNIIANSSFSWWGAWLNNNQNKIVISPKNWFKDASKNTKDLLPETWMKI